MQFTKGGLLAAMMAVALFLPSSAPTNSAKDPISKSGGNAFPVSDSYTPDQKEYYLSANELAYIRPGLNIKIVGVSNVAPGLNPVVEILMTDSLGGALDRNGVATPGTIGVEFVLAQWNAGTYEYINLTTVAFGPGLVYPLHDTGGTWTDVAVGDSKYAFATKLPSTFDVTQTITLGIYATRNTKDILGKNYDAPAAFMDFRPDGGAAKTVFAAIDTSNCNKCHDPISMHEQFGPGVQSVKLCVMCHTSQMPASQTGESLNFKVMLHRIHAGANLPSVQAGTPYVVSPGADFSTVVFPQDLRNCQTCHSSGSATDAAIWRTSPSQAACGSCHDNIDWTTGANHTTGPQTDASCSNCHKPVMTAEWDASIPGAHTVEYKSTQLYGLTMTIVSVTQAAPGQKPIVTFQINDKNGNAIDPRPIDTLRFTMGGPTTDYGTYFSEDALPTVTFDGKMSTYAFQGVIPASATGTWMLTCDVEWTVPLKQGDGKPDNTNFTESPLNPIYYIAMTDPQPVPRRTVVALANCNNCHDRINGHGGQRLVTQGCIVCHNPNNDDSSQRPAAQGAPESISFQRMIHRIHSGVNLTQEYTIYGHGGRKVGFNEVRFPGDRRNCAKCHSGATYNVPTPPGTLNVVTKRDYFSPQGPDAAACLGCHDAEDYAAHAYLNTVTFPSGKLGEACGACHAAGNELGVDKVHAR